MNLNKEIIKRQDKTLTPEEEKEFRQWARKNYKPLDPILGIWHPSVQDECVKINREMRDKMYRILES